MPKSTVNPEANTDAAAHAIDRVLPQTQCERCGYPGCMPYAKAVASGEAAINRCAPGGRETIVALAALLARPAIDPAPDCPPITTRQLARIDEAACIGCLKCVLACPVDAIAGAARHRHQVLPERCTGCELCLAPCPVDCIRIVPIASPWTEADAARAREHYRARQQRRAAAMQPSPAQRDPRAQLSDPAERTRRLALILAQAAQ